LLTVKKNDLDRTGERPGSNESDDTFHPGDPQDGALQVVLGRGASSAAGAVSKRHKETLAAISTRRRSLS